MLRALKNKISGISSLKKFTLLLCALLILTIGVGTTFSYVVTGTPTLINLFLNGMNPDGDLVIQKTVTHPFGDTYTLPEDIAFTFAVDLGEEYAGETVKTTQGEKTADENGVITVTVAPGGRTTVYDIDEGTLVTVTETQIGKGFTPDTVSQEITVQKYQDNTLTFANTYTPEKMDTSALTVSGVKTLAGREWMEGDSFTFELEVNEEGAWTSLGTQTITYELVEQPDPDDSEKTILAPKPDFDKFDFSELIRAYAFDEAGTYSFRITEVEGTIGGVTYDEAESKFDILVGDADMDGYLEIQSITTTSANTIIENTTVSIAFENKYAPAGSAQVSIDIQKVLEDTSGQNKSPAGYTFELYDEAGAWVATSDPTNSTGETSIRLVYEPADAGQTFTYVLKEVGGGQTIGALTYDDTEYKIQVSVVDNLDGTVSAYIYEYQESAGVIQPEGEAESETASESASQPETESETESTSETEPESESQPETENETESTSETESESVSQPETETENESTSETEPESASQSESESQSESQPEAQPQPSKEPVVDLEPLDPNAQKTVVIIPDGAAQQYKAVFTNRYDPTDAEVILTGEKTLSGRDMSAEEFVFCLYEVGTDFIVEDGAQALQTVFNTAAAENAGCEFAFDLLSFSAVGTYRYVVLEDDSTQLGGVTYDQTYYLITIEVSDVNGILTADISITDQHGTEAEIVFANSYKAAPAKWSLEGRKIVTGDVYMLSAGEFSFELYEADDTFAVRGEKPLRTITNDADGQFSLTELTCDGAGPHHYVLVEDGLTEKDGITYDDTVYCITVQVSDPGDGQLVVDSVSVMMDDKTVEDIVFENIYTAPETTPEETTPEETTPEETTPEETTPEETTPEETAPEETTPEETAPEETTQAPKPTPPSQGDDKDTGDTSSVALLTAMAGISAVVLILLLIFRKRRNDPEGELI